MTSYAVLGATGSTGSSLVKVLQQRQDVSVNTLVRSKAKLYRTIPGIEKDSKFEVYEGSITDIDVLTDCIRDTRSVFLAVAENSRLNAFQALRHSLTRPPVALANKPGCTIAQDTAKSVLAALERLRQEKPGCDLPLLIVLSSSSISEKLSRDLPKLLHSFLMKGASYIYDDLRKAETLLRAQENWGVKTVFIKPGGLVHDAQKGHELSTERQQTFLGFLDLAAGMVEVADAKKGTWDMQDVSVIPTAKDVKVEWRVPLFLLQGMLCHYFPWVYPYIFG
ncbi:hypothetical protein LTR15_007903 [Elasticomyces elasticus]|nr:hypothetical protein LTR15_007903 [Elasticomyces elasticus]